MLTFVLIFQFLIGKYARDVPLVLKLQPWVNNIPSTHIVNEEFHSNIVSETMLIKPKRQYD